jgi:hypothetical protein
VLGDVVVEHHELVRVAHRRGTGERGVLRILDRFDPPELRIDRARPGELALRRELQIRGAPDHALPVGSGGGDHAHDGSCLRVATDQAVASTLDGTADITGSGAAQCNACTIRTRMHDRSP